VRAAWLALLLAGCFSGQNFDDCAAAEQCGLGFTCQGGRCVSLSGADAAPDAAPRADARPHDADVSDAAPPDAGGERVISGDVDDMHRIVEAPGERVVLRNVNVRAGYLSVEAREIVVEGYVHADGAGHPGGGGGGGGAGGHDAATLQPGAAGDAQAAPGQANAGLAGGAGGTGASGGGPNGGSGGAAGDPAGRGGHDGAAGHFAAADFDACHFTVGLLLGSGGGGGGGGAGADGAECRAGGGGGGGGAGGPGGGAIDLRAEVAIEVHGTLSARGVGVLDGQRAADAGAADCDFGGSPGACGTDCDDTTAGHGGAGGGSRFSAQPGGAPGADGAGAGGKGGGGAGGMIRLTAPDVRLDDGAALDVSGSEGADNGGFVMVSGHLSGDLQAAGASFRCTSEGD
jgi:hypothetical protein